MSSGWVPPVVSAAKECRHMTGCIALSYLYVNVCKATGHVAGHLYLCFWLLCSEAVGTLEASEAVLV